MCNKGLTGEWYHHFLLSRLMVSLFPHVGHEQHPSNHTPMHCSARIAQKRYSSAMLGQNIRLLEDLAISPLILLITNDEWLVPCPLVVNKLLVLLLLGVELGELVALDIWGDLEGGESFLATDKEGTLDDAVVGLAVDRRSTEDVLAAGLETSQEATNQVGGHEDHGELVVVLVVYCPQGVFLKVDILPEPWKGDLAGLLVGVLALPRRRSVGDWQE